MKKRLLWFSVLVMSVALSGCASLNGDVPFRYQPSLVPVTQKVDKTVGLNMLKDSRPQSDTSYTESITDISEKITAKLLEDFEKSKIFSEIHYPAQPSDDIVINGSIDRFIWKLYATPVAFIPLVPYFGVSCQEAYGIAGITLEIKDNKSQAVLGKFSKESRMQSSYSLYNVKAGEAGAELSDAFRDVAKQLKEDILNKVNWPEPPAPEPAPEPAAESAPVQEAPAQ